VEGRLLGETEMKNRKKTKLVHEGKYVAEVDVEVMDLDAGWSPYLSVEEAQKLDTVRLALRAGDLTSASKMAKIYTLTPVTD
jgi:hypothetical protein